MNRSELAGRLIEASDVEREALLQENRALADLNLAYALKEICYDAWQTSPTRSIQAASAVKILANQNGDEEIKAIADWVGAIAALVEGQMGKAIDHLDAAARRFLLLGKKDVAAETQVSKLIALATLGRYDEAIDCGLSAREVFLSYGDVLAAGKIEHNIGNIHFRRDRYQKAEEFQHSARERFLQAGDQIQLTKIENSLALTLSQQHKIRAAEDLYQQALHRAEASGQLAIQAAIESSIGTLSLFEGRYDRALDYLERSRRKYAVLNMPHMSAMTEQEIADAYLELNLAPEASEIYDRVSPRFQDLGMRAEEARALANNGKAVSLLGQDNRAQELLVKARELYVAERNDVGVATVSLAQAQLFYDQGDYSAAHAAARDAASKLATARTPRPLIFAHWLAGEAARAEGELDEARATLTATLTEAEKQEQPELVARCHTSLGILATTLNDSEAAENHFKAAVGLIEELRAPLPAEEFRTAFFENKLVPYAELARLCLVNDSPRIAEALAYVERAKARALAEAMGGTVAFQTAPRDSFETELFDRLEELRQELNYFYSQINRGLRGIGAPGELELAQLQQALGDREKEVLEVSRQLHHRSGNAPKATEGLDLERLQRSLGNDTALVEYTTIDNRLQAFIVTNDGIDIARDLGSEAEAIEQLKLFRFQIDALRYGSATLRKHLQPLTQRTQKHLESLYDLLLAAIEHRLGARRLVVVPHRALHYVPFHALHDGSAYVVERREVTYAPSALVLQQCLARQDRDLKNALLVGVADEQTPRVDEELAALGPLFAQSEVLLNDKATIESLRARVPGTDVVHLACHGQFRLDNPLFSSLRLGDGWLTVRDAYQLKLNCALVTLSACETGVNAIAPGEEIVGLARGFLSAGARSLILSLWTVDDEATSDLMVDFYKHARGSTSLATALRLAQLRMLENRPHPFFWSPFVLVGGW